MITESIRANEGSMQTLAQDVTEGLGSYLGLSLQRLFDAATVTGSQVHDGFSDPISRALHAWKDLAASDAKALQKAFKTLSLTDASLARQLLGVGV